MALRKTLSERFTNTQSLMGKYGIRFPEANEFGVLRQTFQPMIDAPITSNESVRAIHAVTGQCVFVLESRSGDLVGSMLLIQLTELGLGRLKTGQPLGHVVDPDWVCVPDAVPAALLVWGLLGKTRVASGRVLAFSLALAKGVYSDIPILTYAATPDGARIMKRVGFQSTDTRRLYQLDLTFRKGAYDDG